MKSFFHYLLVECLVVCLALSGFQQAFAATPCSIGMGKPPFLSLGVRPNLLLLLDNSGSMLDMAYTDPDATQCFDDSFDANTTYAGYFDQSSWYEWNSGPYSPWEFAKGYGGAVQPERVYVNGIIYEVQGACTSNGNFLGDDSGCTWEKLINFDSYQLNTSYTTDSFIFDGGQIYQPQSNCTSSGSNLVSDPGCTWNPVDHTWRKNNSYNIGDIVTYKGMYFEASSGGTSSTTSLDDDTGVAWTYLGEGNFVKVAVGDIATHCGSAQGNSDLCVRVDLSKTPDQVTAFVVRGNLLNWAMSSKFDIQKEILTGGKYDAERDLLVSESRGCAGTGYIKQVLLNGGDYLTMRVRGPINKGEPLTWDQVDSTDDTTRLEILGVSSGFDMGACQAAVDKIMTVGSGFQSDVDACLSGIGVADDARSALNHAMSYCWGDTTVRINTIGQNFSDCEAIYSSMQSSGIASYHDAYNCYGVYDETKNHEDRMGYVGRCWQYSGSDCYPKPATGDCTDDSCTYQPDGVNGNLFKNEGGYNYLCSKLKNNGVQCQNDAAFELLYTDASDGSGFSCIPASAGGSDWTENLDGNPSNDHAVDLGLIDTTVIKNTLPGIEDAQWWCVHQAMEDFCGDLNIPEVIDPSDQATATSNYWNIPATLVDSGVMSQLGIDHPLLVMKGYIKDLIQPEGILQSTASDLRIGVMAFNAVGALTECQSADPSDVIENYCPSDNKDGAGIIAEIKSGDVVTDDGGTPADTTDDRYHIDDLVDAINDVRATSWTPLAEAMYNAIGYYTQNTSMRLDADDFDTTTNPITNWCQENHVLIITEGASTADINQDVINFVNTMAINDGDQASDTTCTNGLEGSTYLDDLTYFAQHADANILYPVGNRQLPSDDGTMMDKKNITTHFVATGTLRDDGDTECSPDEIIRDAATNGGTVLLESANPVELESNLLYTLNALSQRASAGSAASVISSARGGEGAIYQAIFWPELKRQDDAGNDWAVTWVGDLHALFIDTNGYMYEDTDGNRIMEPTEDKDNDGVLGTVNEDVDGDGRLDIDEDSNSNGSLDNGEDIDGDGHLDIDEDLDNDGCLDIVEDVDGDGQISGTDKRVIIYFDSNDNRSKGCYNTSVFDSGTCTPADTNSVELANIHFLWAANDWLAKISNNSYAPTNFSIDDIFLNRDGADYISNEPRRHIFTWVDLNNDGDVDETTEVLPFVDRDSSGNPVDWSALAVSNRGSVEKDFNAADNNEVRQIVSWMRGADSPSVRSRQIPLTDGSSTFITWRLGDIIHSTPMTVAAPAEAYHLIYNDASFARFLSRYKRRRHVVYFGANDGMLHAVNGGFYSEKERKFCLVELNADGTCTDTTVNAPSLGAELWAYVPYNLLPHLKCLTDTGYAGDSHKYYVDLRPRIFDAKIFTPEPACAAGHTDPACIHPEGWGTILVGGMRFGGAPVDAEADLNQTSGTDNRRFISSYFILDITNPEKPPTLLGELTQTLTDTDADGIPDEPDYVDLGYSTVISTMVIMKDNKGTAAEENDWYLILGSGPHGSDALKGVSDQTPKLSVLYLNDLVDGTIDNKAADKAMRISKLKPAASGTLDGTFDLSLTELGKSGNGFVSDPITIDFDINPSAENYKADAVYFGTVEGDFASDAFGSTSWDGGGILYRLVTREIDGVGHSEYGPGVTENITEPYQWEIKPLIDLSIPMTDANGNSVNPKPITASPAAATDGRNFWIYFGTGRFFDADDKTDVTQQTYYGIKEPMEFTDSSDCTNSTRKFTWEEVELTGSDTNFPGGKGLLQVDDILVTESSFISSSSLSCWSGGSCLPTGVSKFNQLIDYIAGSGSCTDAYYDGHMDGWYRDFYPYGNRERNLGQAALLGGLLTFTTYQPYEDRCQAEGLSYLYGLYYQTGTAWHQHIFDGNSSDVEEKISLGRGLALTPNLHVGSGDDGKGPKAFVQTTTGEIKEIVQQATPYKVTPGKTKWQEFTGCP